MHDHTEEKILAWLNVMAFVGLAAFAFFYLYVPAKNPEMFMAVFTALAGQLGAHTSALHRAMGVKGHPKPDPPADGLSPRLPGT